MVGLNLKEPDVPGDGMAVLPSVTVMEVQLNFRPAWWHLAGSGSASGPVPLEPLLLLLLQENCFWSRTTLYSDLQNLNCSGSSSLGLPSRV